MFKNNSFTTAEHNASTGSALAKCTKENCFQYSRAFEQLRYVIKIPLRKVNGSDTTGKFERPKAVLSVLSKLPGASDS